MKTFFISMGVTLLSMVGFLAILFYGYPNDMISYAIVGGYLFLMVGVLCRDKNRPV